jgi:transporter family-2 protein
MSFAGGVLFALQAPINMRLGNIMGGPVIGAFLSFLTGTIVLSVILAVQRKPVLLSQISSTSPWMWIGGTLGAFMVFASIYSVSRLGSAGMLVLVIGGQILASLIIDHYGILVPNAVAASPLRLAGAAVMVTGILMILYPKFQ